jgi:hypothetical protein
VRHEDRHVAEQVHAMSGGVAPERAPLLRERVLLEAQGRDPRRQLRRGARQRLGLAPAQRRLPLEPRQRAVRLADRGEQRVILEPTAVGAPGGKRGRQPGIARAGRGEARSSGVQRPLAATRARAHRIQFAALEQPAVVQPVQADQARIAGVDRGGVVGREVLVRRPEREHLPHRAAGAGKELDETVGGVPQVAAAEGRGQRAQVQQHAGAPRREQQGAHAGSPPVRITPPRSGAPVPRVKLSDR